MDSDKSFVTADPNFLLGVMLSALEKIRLIEETSYFQKLKSENPLSYTFMQKFFITKEALSLISVDISLQDFLPLNGKKMRQVFSRVIRFFNRVRELESCATENFEKLKREEEELERQKSILREAKECLAEVETARAEEQETFAQITGEIDFLEEELKGLETERRAQELSCQEETEKNKKATAQLEGKLRAVQELSQRSESLSQQIVEDHLEMRERNASLDQLLTEKREEVRLLETATHEKTSYLARTESVARVLSDYREVLAQLKNKQLELERLRTEVTQKEFNLRAEEEVVEDGKRTEQHLKSLLEQEKVNLADISKQYADVERSAEEERSAAAAARDQIWEELALRNRNLELATQRLKVLLGEKEGLEEKAKMYFKSMESMHSVAKQKLEDYHHYIRQTLGQSFFG